MSKVVTTSPSPAQSFHGMNIADVVAGIDSDLEEGLASVEAARRCERYGWNELPLKPGRPAWQSFLLQFHQPLLYILLIAGGVKAFLGAWTNAFVIWGVTFINAIIGYVQEAKAENSIAALAKAVTTFAVGNWGADRAINFIQPVVCDEYAV